MWSILCTQPIIYAPGGTSSHVREPGIANVKRATVVPMILSFFLGLLGSNGSSCLRAVPTAVLVHFLARLFETGVGHYSFVISGTHEHQSWRLLYVANMAKV